MAMRPAGGDDMAGLGSPKGGRHHVVVATWPELALLYSLYISHFPGSKAMPSLPSLLSSKRKLRTQPPFPLPERLSAIGETDIHETPFASALPEVAIAAIWRAMKALYASGMSPGIALSLRHRGHHVFHRTLGYADLNALTPLGIDTPVCLFSASKAVTAMLAHHLVEQGELDLHQRVAHYLPAYGCHGKEQTTLMHLLTHRGGIPRISEPVSVEDLFQPERLQELMIRAVPEQPGRRQAYHALTAGFVLGAVIEAVTGESLNTLLDRVVRHPMGMTNFSYGLSNVRPATNYLTGRHLSAVDAYLSHAIGGSLADAVTASNDPRFQQVTIPAGNLYATAAETSAFYQMLLDQGRWQDQTIFKAGTVQKAIAPVKGPRLDRTLLMPLNYSAGFMLGGQNISLYGRGTSKAFGHLGFVSIYSWADPERALAGTLLTTGKGLIGSHFPQLLRLQSLINQYTKARL